MESKKKQEEEAENAKLQDWKERVEEKEKEPTIVQKQQTPVEPIATEPRMLPPVRATSETFKLKFTPRTMKNIAAREEKDEELLKKYELWKSAKKSEKNDENGNDNLY